MASLSTGRNGRITLYFFDHDGRRRKLGLGPIGRRQALAFKSRIEQLVSDLKLGASHDEALVAWMRQLPPGTVRRLSLLGMAGRERQAMSLGELIERYMSTKEVKEGTMRTYEQCATSLIRHFGKERRLDTIKAMDADEWRSTLAKTGKIRKMRGTRSLAGATVAKRINVAKAMFTTAATWGLIDRSPFTGMKSGSQVNQRRSHFVSAEETRRLLDECPDAEWRALVGVLRYAGLRCPSEIRELQWSDVDLDRRAMRVRSSKNEAHPNAIRMVPIQPRLLPLLLALRGARNADQAAMFTLASRSHGSIYQKIRGLASQAGLRPWPRLLHNLRATCETEWAAEFPLHEVARWLGHSPLVAAKHYLQPRDSNFMRAAGLVVTHDAS